VTSPAGSPPAGKEGKEVMPISKLEFILFLVMMGVLVYNFFPILEVIQ